MGDENSDDDDAFESADEDEFPSAIPKKIGSASKIGAENPKTASVGNPPSPRPVDDLLRVSAVDPESAPERRSPKSINAGSSSAVSAGRRPASDDIPAPASDDIPAPASDSDASWSSWSSWGASLLSTASKSVSQFSTEVTEGLNVLVDASITVADADADAEKLARQAKDAPPIVSSQPAVHIPPLSSGQLPPEDSQCPTAADSTSTSASSSSTALSSLTSGIFSSSSSASVALGNLNPSNLPSFASFSSALSAASSAAASSAATAAASALSSPSAAASSAASATNAWTTHLMEGGLEVLERVGRKTMDALKESDAGIEETTRAIFDDAGAGRPTLSQLLREGKTLKETEDGKKEEMEEKNKDSLQYWFDEFKGMAHLEALELLSARCESDLKDSLTVVSLHSFYSKLAAIKDLFEAEEEEEEEEDDDFDEENVDPDFASFFSGDKEWARQHVEKFQPTSAVEEPAAASTTAASSAADQFVEAVGDALRKVKDLKMEVAKRDEMDGEEDEAVRNRRGEENVATPADVQRASVQSLGKLVASSVQLFHKIGQITLVPPFKCENAAESSIDGFLERSTHLLVLSRVIVDHTNVVAKAYGELLLAFEGRRSEIEINQKMTDLFLEASQGTSHVKSAFKLLLPVLQFRFFKETQESAT